MAKKVVKEKTPRKDTRYKTGMLGLDLLTIQVPKVDGKFIYEKEELIADPTLIQSLPKGISPYSSVLLIGNTGSGKTTLSHLMSTNIIMDNEEGGIPYTDESKTESKSKIILYQTEPGAISEERLINVGALESIDEYDAVYETYTSDSTSYEHLTALIMQTAQMKKDDPEKYMIKKKAVDGSIIEEYAPTIFIVDSTTALKKHSDSEAFRKANLVAIEKTDGADVNVAKSNNRKYQYNAMALKDMVAEVRDEQEETNIIILYMAHMKENKDNKRQLPNGSTYYVKQYSNLPGHIKPDGIYEAMPFEMSLAIAIHKDISVQGAGKTWVTDCGMEDEMRDILDKGFTASIFKSRFCASSEGTDFTSILTVGGIDPIASLIYDCRERYDLFRNNKFTFKDSEGKVIREDGKNKVIPLNKAYNEIIEEGNADLFYGLVKEYVRGTVDKLYYQRPKAHFKI